MHRDPDDPAVVGEAAFDALSDPPGGVGGELEAERRVELVGRPHQPDVAVLDPIEELQIGVPVDPRQADDQAQVGLHELGVRSTAAVPGAAGRHPLLLGQSIGPDRVRQGRGGLQSGLHEVTEPDLVLGLQQSVPADLCHVGTKSVEVRRRGVGLSPVFRYPLGVVIGIFQMDTAAVEVLDEEHLLLRGEPPPSR